MTRVVQDKYHDSRSPQLVYLVVTTYGGEHLYGTLRWYTMEGTNALDFTVERLDIEAVLSRSAARQMNRSDPSYTYKVGEDCGKFLDVRDLKVAGLAAFRDRFNPDSHVLIMKHTGCLDPSEVLNGPEPWRTEINEIHQEFEDGDRWAKSLPRAKEIATRYETKMMEVIPAHAD